MVLNSGQILLLLPLNYDVATPGLATVIFELIDLTQNIWAAAIFNKYESILGIHPKSGF